MNIQILKHGKYSTAVWEMTLCVSSLGTHESHSHVCPWLMLKKSQIYVYRLFTSGAAKPKCEPPRLSPPVSDVFWKNKTSDSFILLQSKVWTTWMPQDPARLICHIKLVNIHSKPCELCQVLEEFSDLLLIWKAVQQDFRWRLTFEEALPKTPTETVNRED